MAQEEKDEQETELEWLSEVDILDVLYHTSGVFKAFKKPKLVRILANRPYRGGTMSLRGVTQKCYT